MRAMKTYELDVAVTRGEGIESEHRVHAAVVGDDDELLGAARDPDSFTYWRSCAKPFQIIPFLSSGGFDALGWGEEQLAVSCASHDGEPEHVDAPRGVRPGRATRRGSHRDPRDLPVTHPDKGQTLRV